MSRNPSQIPDQTELKQEAVFQRFTGERCTGCGEMIPVGDYAAFEGKSGKCLTCAGLENHVFLPSGNVALTRRATKYSSRAVVALAFSRRRKRWERRGTFVEEAALTEAEIECALDGDRREAARTKARARAEVVDQQYIVRFAEAIRTAFPGLPAGVEEGIATHACQKHSGRVGRTAAAKELDAEMVTLAVVAHARHCYTDYDALLDKGVPKAECRERIAGKVQDVMDRWRRSKG